MDEIWKDIEWYNGFYQISNLWIVKSLKFWKEKILIPGKTKSWYLTILLSKEWKTFSVTIHRLVWIHFIPNPLNLPCVLHKDETLDEKLRLYNWADNLWWGTQKDNAMDRNRKWRWFCFFKWKENKWKWKLWKDHFNSKKVNQYTTDWTLIKNWCSMIEASNWTSTHRWNISECCNKQRKTAGGFIWKYC